MSKAVPVQLVPRGAIVGAAALIGFSIFAAGITRFTGMGAVHASHGTEVQTATFRFEDRPDGGISVIAPDSGSVIAVVPAGTDGFVRTVLRSLAFDRQRHRVGAGPVFVVARWSDGQATIDDPATGRRVDLAAFGRTNMQLFEHMVELRGDKS